MLLLIGCAAHPDHVPLGSPDDGPPGVGAVAEPPGADEETVGTIEEEPLFDEIPVGPDAGPDGSLSVEPSTLEHTIGATTAPNVAAATRLVDDGRVRMAAGDFGGALECFERGIAIDSGNQYAYYYLAELHLRHHTYDQAIAFADRAANLSQTRAPEWASRAYTLQGNAFEASGRLVDARNAYQRAIQAAPGNLAAQVGLARVSQPSQQSP